MWQALLHAIHGEIVSEYRGCMICKHHLFLSWKQYTVTYQKYGENSKTWCKEYVRFSNQMSAFAETKKICESRHIKSVVIVSLNTHLIFIQSRDIYGLYVVNLKNVEKNLKRDR